MTSIQKPQESTPRIPSSVENPQKNNKNTSTRNNQATSSVPGEKKVVSTPVSKKIKITSKSPRKYNHINPKLS
jgi:FtsZ-interacting cell division protein YlmF